MRHEDNEGLVRVGPGTLMGQLMRRYWIPVVPSADLPVNDSAPVRVRLLGEDLVVFRDSSGGVGLLEEFCQHRRASLYYGRVEEGGLRCSYHGWKYDIHGNCVELPQEPAYAAKIKAVAYPCIEAGDVIWGYMGPPELMPPPPRYEWAQLQPEQRFVSRWLQQSNYLQGLEGAIDASHVSFLHRFELERDPLLRKTGAVGFIKGDASPEFEVDRSEGGLVVYARRVDNAGKAYYRITQLVVPWFAFPPPWGPHPLICQGWVPRDDESCIVWNVNYAVDRVLNRDEIVAMQEGAGIHVKYQPGTLLPIQNRSNEYLMNRDLQRAKVSFSGVLGLAAQDASIQESMGPIIDRTKEHLVRTDRAVVELRRMLLAAARALASSGTAPPGLTEDGQCVRPASLVLDASEDVRQVATAAQLAAREQRILTV